WRAANAFPTFLAICLPAATSKRGLSERQVTICLPHQPRPIIPILIIRIVPKSSERSPVTANLNPGHHERSAALAYPALALQRKSALGARLQGHSAPAPRAR